VDPRAIDPQTALPIGVDGLAAIQSHDHCHAFKFVLANDSQQLYNDHSKAFFWFFELLEIINKEQQQSWNQVIGFGQI
jgi:hypothetical protein